MIFKLQCSFGNEEMLVKLRLAVSLPSQGLHFPLRTGLELSEGLDPCFGEVLL